jgi:hypothetical protein
MAKDEENDLRELKDGRKSEKNSREEWAYVPTALLRARDGQCSCKQ